jgi:hypothetical protein
MIVLDEQLSEPLLRHEIKRWHKGAVINITEVRPHTHIPDDTIPALLRTLKDPTFVTINYADFWPEFPASRAYCAICLKLSKEQVREVPEILRGVLSLPEWRTKRGRMGAVISVTDRGVTYYQS